MTEAEIRIAVDRHVAPHLRAGALGHILYGTPTGGFLQAVFANDLAQAALRAVPPSLDALPSLARFLINDAPGECWGSPERAQQWRERGGLLRDKDTAK